MKAISTFWDGDRLESFLNGLQVDSNDEIEEIILPSEPYKRKRKEPVDEVKKTDPNFTFKSTAKVVGAISSLRASSRKTVSSITDKLDDEKAKIKASIMERRKSADVTSLSKNDFSWDDVDEPEDKTDRLSSSHNLKSLKSEFSNMGNSLRRNASVDNLKSFTKSLRSKKETSETEEGEDKKARLLNRIKSFKGRTSTIEHQDSVKNEADLPIDDTDSIAAPHSETTEQTTNKPEVEPERLDIPPKQPEILDEKFNTISAYKSAIQHLGDSRNDELGQIFVIFAQQIPKDIKSNLSYYQSMDLLLAYFEKFIRLSLEKPSTKFSIVYITGLSSKDNLPNVSFLRTHLRMRHKHHITKILNCILRPNGQISISRTQHRRCMNSLANSFWFIYQHL